MLWDSLLVPEYQLGKKVMIAMDLIIRVTKDKLVLSHVNRIVLMILVVKLGLMLNQTLFKILKDAAG